MNTIYGVQCNCGLQYVGESSHNLKVRIKEHLAKSSASAISIHVRENDHAIVPHNTIILASEKNNRKRKILESLFIENKFPLLCNTGPSLETPLTYLANLHGQS